MAWVARYWNAVTALTAIFLVGVFAVVPPLQDHVSVVVFVAAVGGLLLMIDIRVGMDRPPSPKSFTAYESMRAARTEIVTRMREVISKSRQGGAEIVISGGRIRSITDIIRDIADEIDKRQLTACEVRIRIFASSPEALRRWRIPGEMDATTQTGRNRDYASQVISAERELSDYSARERFRAQRITVEVLHYDELPYFYCFLLDRQFLFWGFFMWDAETSDMIGPANRCYYMDASNPEFRYFYDWFLNRTNLMQALAYEERDASAGRPG